MVRFKPEEYLAAGIVFFEFQFHDGSIQALNL